MISTEMDRLRAQNAALVKALEDLIPYARATIGLPEPSWSPDNVILQARAAMRAAKGGEG